MTFAVLAVVFAAATCVPHGYGGSAPVHEPYGSHGSYNDHDHGHKGSHGMSLAFDEINI